MPSWQRSTEAVNTPPEIHGSSEGGCLQFLRWEKTTGEERFRALRLRCNGTAQLLTKDYIFRQARAAHRLAAPFLLSIEPYRIVISCGSPGSQERPAHGAGAQLTNAAAPRPRRRLSKGGIERFGHHDLKSSTQAVEGGNRFLFRDYLIIGVFRLTKGRLPAM